MAPLINFSGIASGIDSSSLISAILDQQRKAQIAPLQKRVDELTATNSAFEELTTKLESLKSAANSFRAISGGTIAKSTTSSNESVLYASASNAAQNGTYSVTVTQLARAATYSFADRYTSSTDVVNGSINNGASAGDRTVSISIGNGSDQETVDIELTNTTTIGDIVTQFNASSSKGEAALVNVGTSSAPSYAIVFSSRNTGVDKGEINVSVGSEVQTAGSGAFNTGTATLTQALNAEFSLSGISGTIERSSNSIGDIISGVTLNLSSLGTSTITVSSDAETSKQAIKKFVEAYNDVISFVQENDLVTQEQDGSDLVSIFGPLAESSVDDNILSQLRSTLLNVSQSGREVSTLADFGITTERDGTLSFNEDTYASAFARDSEGIRLITESLGEQLSSVDGVIAQFTRFNGLIDTSVNANTLDIDAKQDRIAELEASLAKQQNGLTSQFARLESLIGRLNQQQNSLSSILPR